MFQKHFKPFFILGLSICISACGADMGINMGFGGTDEPITTQINETRAVADCPAWTLGLAWVMDRESYSACWGLN